MATDLRQKLERISGKARLLTERYVMVLDAKAAAMQRISDLEAELEKQSKEIERLKAQLEFQQMATTLAPSREEVDKSRAVLSKLVREIDKCIEELND